MKLEEKQRDFNLKSANKNVKFAIKVELFMDHFLE